jgi:hypothetical protein
MKGPNTMATMTEKIQELGDAALDSLLALVKNSAGKIVSGAQRMAEREASILSRQTQREALDRPRPEIEAIAWTQVGQWQAEFYAAAANFARHVGGAIAQDGDGYTIRRGAGWTGLFQELQIAGALTPWHWLAVTVPDKLVAALMTGSDRGAHYADQPLAGVIGELNRDAAALRDVRAKHRAYVAAAAEAGVTIPPLESNRVAAIQLAQRQERAARDHSEWDRANRKLIEAEETALADRELAQKRQRIAEQFGGGISYRDCDIDRILAGELLPDGVEG